jgi:two-component sensor histidine kinase/tetratricopeptide (TPR) repeat protein
MICSYRATFLLLTCLFTGSAVLSQGSDLQNTFYVDSLKTELRRSKPDTNRINLLLLLTDPFVTSNDNKSHNLDTALSYTRQADSLSNILKFTKGLILGRYHLASLLVQKGETQKAEDMLLEGIKISKESGYNRQGAEGWYTLRDTYIVSKEKLSEVILWYERAMIVSQKIGNRQIEADILMEIAFLHHQQGEHALGATELERVLILYQAVNNAKLHYVYDLLSAINQSLGNYPEALKYGLATIESAKSKGDTFHLANFHIRLGRIYRDLKQNQEALTFFENSLRHAQSTRQELLYFNALSLVSSTLIFLGREEEGLAVVLENTKINPPKDQVSSILVSEILANCYLALKQYPAAEKYLVEMLSYQEKRQQDDLYKMIVMQKAGRLYLEMEAYSRSKFYVDKAVALNLHINSSQAALANQLLFFKLDSAQGRLQEAIGNYQLYKSLHDSIYNDTQSKQIANLEVRYETEKKEKDLLLKEQSIKTLTKERLLQEEKMKQDQLIRNIIIGGAILLLLLLAVIYNRYRLKQQSNRLLQAQQSKLQAQHEELQTQQASLQEQQQRIHQKNQALEQLLVEKEWLLREIHHRVKNNLQIVMSLLNSQVASLQDKAALSAIQDSQNRVQAMALIHQKLYQVEGVVRIPMNLYVEEVVAYLRDSYALSRQVSFKLYLEPIELDVNLAVPLGLIINEAITNAFKYAFPGERSGAVHLSLLQKSDISYELTIEDDGVGLPKAYDPSQSRSLGMTLIHGFSSQLGAELSIESTQGVKISLVFWRRSAC